MTSSKHVQREVLQGLTTEGDFNGGEICRRIKNVYENECLTRLQCSESVEQRFFTFGPPRILKIRYRFTQTLFGNIISVDHQELNTFQVLNT